MGRCCITPEPSSCRARELGSLSDEQTIPGKIPHNELACVQRCAQAPRIADGLA